MTPTVVPTTSTTLTVGSDIRPTRVTFDFGPEVGGSGYLTETAPSVPTNASAPNAIIKVMDGGTHVHVPDSGLKVAVDGNNDVHVHKDDGDGCYFNDDGHCPVHGV